MLFYLLAALGLVPTFQKTKCKKLLNLSVERIKLLEKRHEAQVRQLDRDVIELLQLKKEHKVDPLLRRIWKELCLFSVYAKIKKYCGDVQISLKDIAGQRECPSGLEEPLAGLCFAASCCADLPELQELREIFAMKYGTQIVSSAQDLKPNCHVNKEFLDCLYSKDPSTARKQALLEEIVANYNAVQGHEQDMQQLELCDSVSAEGSVVANDCDQSKEGINDAMEVSEIEDHHEFEELQDADVVQGPYHIETVCREEDPGSVKLGNELASRKRSLEDRETHCSAFKRVYSRKFWLNKAMEGEENGSKQHEQTAEKARDSGTELCSDAGERLASEHHYGYKNCGVLQGEGITAAHMNKGVTPREDLHIVHYIQQPSFSRPPHRPPPPPPPPKRAPPPSPSLRVISMPSFRNDKLVNVNTSLPRPCSAMANDYYIDSYGSHVHPRLPKYEDLVANFTARKR